MKCSRRLIRSFASAALVLACGSATLAGRGVTPVDARVQVAIEDAVAQRLGPDAIVTVQVTEVRVGEVPDGIVALPDQGTRVGASGRFTLFASGSRRVRIGEATALVSVTAETIRLKRAVARGAMLDVADIEQVHQALDGPLTPAARLEDIIGARARRDLAPGSTVSRADVIPEPIIKSGDSVRVIVRIGGVEVSGTAIALQSGAKNEVIRLTNPASRKTLMGRVVRRGEVEVIDAY